MVSFVLSTLILGISYVATQYTGCDYYHTLSAGEVAAIYSPNYPQNYRSGTKCRWALAAPSGSTIYLNCIDVSIPNSSGCTIDRILVSLTGRPDLADGLSFCGTGSFARYSTTSQLTLALQSDSRSVGGRFYCEASIQQACSCGRRKLTKIVGGMATSINEFTMMAGIVDIDVKEISCGATIISDFYVLTAAHCINSKNMNRYAVIVGEHNPSVGSETPYAAIYTLQRVVQHSSYNSASQTNDIALGQTSKRIDYNLGVGPACLPFKFLQQSFAGQKVEAVGWGTLSYAGIRPEVLQKVTLDVIANSVCRNTYSTLMTNQICTLTPSKDTCQFDSGGGLHYTDTNSLLYLAGIVSYGTGCGQSRPSVNTRVTEYLQWISANTPGVVYCKI